MANKEIKGLVSALIILLIVIGFGGFKYYVLGKTNTNLQTQITEKDKQISNTEFEKKSLQDALTDEQNKNQSFQDEIDRLTNKVGGLVKLSNTDQELLQKYSKVFFLSENYAPRRLASIDDAFVFPADRKLQFLSQAEPFLNSLLLSAKKAGLDLKVQSAYRSFGTQADLKSTYKVVYGSGTANQFSADQGYSEHQLGTAVDFTTPSVGTGLDGFDKTPEYQWLLTNAYTYGFVLSYPPNNNYYIFEPWHWRFVGQDLAYKLHHDNKYFYQLDQRDLDKYLATIFDN